MITNGKRIEGTSQRAGNRKTATTRVRTTESAADTDHPTRAIAIIAAAVTNRQRAL
jgi:hypothetical protein